MTEATPGLELFLSSEKAVAGANAFRDAVESAAKAVENIDGRLIRFDGTLDGLSATTATSATGDLRDVLLTATKAAEEMGATMSGVGSTLGSVGREIDATAVGIGRVGTATSAAGASIRAKLDAIAMAEGAAAMARRRNVADIASHTAVVTRLGTAASSVGSAMRALSLGEATSALLGLGQAGAIAGSSLTAVSNVAHVIPGHLGLIAGLAGAAAAAFFAFGSSADETSIKMRAFIDQAREAEGVASRFDAMRLAILGGQARAGEQFLQTIKEQLLQLDQLQQRGVETIPAAQALGAIEQAAPVAIANLRKAMEEIAKFGAEGKDAPQATEESFRKLYVFVRDSFGFEIKRVREDLGAIERVFSGSTALGPTVGFTIKTEDAVKLLQKQFNRLTADAEASAKAIQGARQAAASLATGPLPVSTDSATPRQRAAAVDPSQTKAVQEFLQAQRQAFDAISMTVQQQREQLLLAGLVAAAAREGRGVRLEELATAAQLTAEMRQQAAANVEKQRADTTREVIDRLRRENALLEVQGAQREALRAQQEIELLLSQKKASATAEEQQQIDALLATRRQLLELDEQRKAFLRTSREDNRDLTRAARDAEQAALQYGDALSSALGSVVINGEKARDVIGSLARDMSMMALKSTTSPLFAQLFQAGGKAIANWLTPGASQEEGWFSNLTGGVIPALDGQVLAEFGMLARGRDRYSFAEGGSTTPEAIFPLQRDSRGRLGVAAGDGGGGSVIHMSFPNVRNAADARAARATLGQRMRRLGIETRGRRGLRPGGA